jgi:inner membrane protein
VPRSLWLVGVACAVLPDADSAGYAMGIPYHSLWGHRGLSHSVPAAAVIALLAVGAFRGLRGRCPSLPLAWGFLFLCTVTHGVLDALTNGGLGVAFFAPFSNHRYFFPWGPIQVSPLGLYDFFSGEAWPAVRSELLWIGIPCAALLAGAALRRRMRTPPA